VTKSISNFQKESKIHSQSEAVFHEESEYAIGFKIGARNYVLTFVLSLEDDLYFYQNLESLKIVFDSYLCDNEV